MRHLTEIIIHCSATRDDWMQGQSTAAKVAEIKRWHMDDNGWSDIGYHWIIDRDGTVAAGRTMERDGAHVKGHNKGTVGVCLLGGFGSSENDSPYDHYTAEQMASLRKLIGKLQFEYQSITKVTGHNQYAAKACPGFQVKPWLNETKPKTDKVLESGTNKAAIGAAATTVCSQTVPALVTDNAFAQNVITVGLVGAGLMCLGYILYSRIKKQKRGIL